ncbi:Lysophospholipase L2 [Litoreibacter arenae DSM 19593]|uniref:Lysophospholipase L2 n=1 Tax=Litoreibacter arenae DSM 19593 TaxID=1123360 RepID=S9QA74_9RHOB|nr:Lysophospholipase L2 [Litoreibacter arenae DSM 19593]
MAADRNMIHVERFSDYQKDVASLSQAAEELELPKPWFLIGSSMGACIGLRALANGLSVSACAFTSPMWGIGLKPMERVGAWTVSRTFCAIGRSQTYCPGHNAKNYASCTAFEGNRITNDGDMYQLWRDQAAAKPELQTGGSSMGWLYQGLAECRSLSKIPAPNVPCIAFCGEQDAIVDVRAIQDRMASWPNGELEMMRDVGHELLLERPLVQERIMSRLSDLSGMVVKCG